MTTAPVPTVLVGFADALAAPEVVFSLQAAGFGVRLLARPGAAASATRLVAPDDIRTIPGPEVDTAASVASLRTAAAGADVILAIDDAALWLVDAAFGEGGPVPSPRPANATGALARFALDKRLQIEAARQSGFTVPPTVVIESLDEMRGTDGWPVIVKPALAGQVVRGSLHRGGAGYAAGASDIDALRSRDIAFPALVQPLIAGAGEGIFGFATHRGVVGWSGHRRIRMMNPHGSGASACRSIPVAPALRETASRLVEHVGWRGPFMVELLRAPDGTAHFVEFNGRLWGSTALARRAGLEYPAWAVRQALDPGFVPEPPLLREGLVVRHLGRELLHLLFVARGPQTAFHRANWPSLIGSAAAVLRPGPRCGFYNFDPSRPWFFLREAADTVSAFARRKRS